MPAARPQLGNYLILPGEIILCPACVPDMPTKDEGTVKQLKGYSRCERCGEGRKTQFAPPLAE
jgi:hypothetical protein